MEGWKAVNRTNTYACIDFTLTQSPLPYAEGDESPCAHKGSGGICLQKTQVGDVAKKNLIVVWSKRKNRIVHGRSSTIFQRQHFSMFKALIMSSTRVTRTRHWLIYAARMTCKLWKLRQTRGLAQEKIIFYFVIIFFFLFINSLFGKQRLKKMMSNKTSSITYVIHKQVHRDIGKYQYRTKASQISDEQKTKRGRL